MFYEIKHMVQWGNLPPNFVSFCEKVFSMEIYCFLHTSKSPEFTFEIDCFKPKKRFDFAVVKQKCTLSEDALAGVQCTPIFWKGIYCIPELWTVYRKRAPRSMCYTHIWIPIKSMHPCFQIPNAPSAFILCKATVGMD